MAEVEVRVIPRAARDEIAGERAGRLLIRLTAPPVVTAPRTPRCAASSRDAPAWPRGK
jgi:hypothetical protein